MKPAILLILLVAGQAIAGDTETFTPGGAVGPGGVQVACDIPPALRLTNTGGMGLRGPGTGAGLCVWTSMEHSGRYQNVQALVGLQKYMTTQEGGGYPQKVDAVMRKFAPGVDYLQHTEGDVAWLKAALKTGRPVCITYCGHDPRYNDTIAHMVNLLYLGDGLACILDNNYPDRYLWMSEAEFVGRWKGIQANGQPYLVRDKFGRPSSVGGGWAIVFTAPCPPPAPRLSR